MKHLAGVAVFACLLVASLDAKGPTIRIEIRDLALGTVTQMTDRSLVSQFNVWSGPGTYSGPSGQVTEGTDGFIVDWRRGSINERPTQLKRYELRFFSGPRPGKSGRPDPPETLAYIVLYENDPSTGEGYVYLPGRGDPHFALNVRSIHRDGLNGHWFRANREWQAAFARLPLAR